MTDPVLALEGLTTTFPGEAGPVVAVDGVSLVIRPGEIVGLVGESGSGKSVTSLSVMRLLPEQAAHPSGRVVFLGRDLLTLSTSELTALRGRDLAMVFQEPMTSLNPVLRVGEQVAEVVRRHAGASRAEARARAIALFGEVGLPDPDTLVDRFPHELSGGQKQRVTIAAALACAPKLILADEPTTALDVTVQAQILDLLRALRDRHGAAVLFVTHDLGVVGELADRVAVMHRGRIVEEGPVLDVLERPRHPYTRALLACRPTLDGVFTTLPTVADFLDVREQDGRITVVEREPSPERLAELTAPWPRPVDAPVALEVQGLTVAYPTARDLLGRVTARHLAVDDVSFTIRAGRTLGLVGESGCGKTTTARAILRLVRPTAGTVRFEGVDLAALDHGRADAVRALRRAVQIVFQDPYGSLDPRQTVQDALTEPMQVHGLGRDARDRRDRAAALLEEVGLTADALRRHPHAFSGGQRQRIAIARALSVEPRLLVCDEAVSALDVSVAAQVLNLLKGLQRDRGLTYLFVSHDLAVVRFMADDVAVMHGGRLVEVAPAERLYEAPEHPTTRALLGAVPRGDAAAVRARLGR